MLLLNLRVKRQRASNQAPFITATQAPSAHHLAAAQRASADVETSPDACRSMLKRGKRLSSVINDLTRLDRAIYDERA
jgi:hypothetical protein